LQKYIFLIFINKKMDEQTIFVIFFVLIALSFNYGNKNFYESSNIEFLIKGDYDDVFYKLVSIGIVSIICAFYWNYYVNKYV